MHYSAYMADGRTPTARPARPLTRRATTPSSAAAFAAEVGRLVRLGRAKRGMTRRQLAQDSGISERYLAQIESGAGNPSVIVLRAIADALEVPITELFPGADARHEALGPIVDLLGRVPPAEWPALAETIEARVAQANGDDRARRIALVGLRGAGKSTLGRMLAEHLGYAVHRAQSRGRAGIRREHSDLIEMSGVATFRRYERSALERVIAEHETVVITTAGGIVANPETYALLLRRTHTVWVKARPDEHMSRVMAQGDFRPMAENRERHGRSRRHPRSAAAPIMRAPKPSSTPRRDGRAELFEAFAHRRAVAGTR